MTNVHRYGSAAVVCLLSVALLAGCGKGGGSHENIIATPLETQGASLFDVADAQRNASDKLLAARAVAETAAEQATVVEAEALKQRGDGFLRQKAYSEANEAYLQCIRKCDAVISAHVSG